MKNRIELVLRLLLLLLMLGGCTYRDILDEYPVAGVKVTLDWEGVTQKLPEGVKAIFYSNDGAGLKIESFLPLEGGEMNVPPGHYSVVVYNYDTQAIRIKGEERYETIEAYTGYRGNSSQNTVWEPDELYVANVHDIEIGEGVMELNLKPRSVIQTNPFCFKVERLENVASVVGHLEGMANCYLLGLGRRKTDGCTIYFEAGKGDGTIEGGFSSFGMPQESGTRAAGEVTMKLKMLKVDNTVQEVKIDLTKKVAQTPPPIPGGAADEEVIPPPPPPVIELPDDEPIIVDKVDPGHTGGGGIGGSVEDWGEEDNVTLE